MDTVKQRLIQELDKTPTPLLQEIFDFVLFLKQRYSQNQPHFSAGWQPNFFEEVIGSWEGEKLVREAQPDYEQREELL
ncbi:hypothetical protein XM38_006980 [Halomicronema hongdechloris C2206]|uniref:DUF2281 domain-containing protein n=1 Tax=Halomicronema hongdechloris C2206 TaxID=1641165 RepID=A0A1Z3HHH3_9CYAN|nr:hypothetical protein [Halomicronema hongdechloris]ASC69769.1 hypothetical protein XM38_006980 [Halomicronema hongdechloris C2206]